MEWLKTIGGENKSSLDVPTLKKMFEIGFQTHAATSLCVRVKEMPAVPAAVAKAHNEPEVSYSLLLCRKDNAVSTILYKMILYRVFSEYFAV